MDPLMRCARRDFPACADQTERYRMVLYSQ